MKRELLALVPRLSGHQVLVVGDLFLDEYLLGQAMRLSREAPIPVVELRKRFYIPGGGANPARNVCALGGAAAVVGLVGDDAAGKQLLSELHTAGIDATGVVVDSSRRTTTKTRIMADGSLRFPQQVARVDCLDRRGLDTQVEERLVAQVLRLVPQVDAVLVSDYQTGVASSAVVAAVLQGAHSHNKLCTVDAQGAFEKYAGYSWVKGNREEMQAALGRELCSEESFRVAGEELLTKLGAKALAITRGAEGLSLIARDEGHVHLAAANRSEVFDVTGAGDTVIAVATLALLAGASCVGAARLANYAAGLVVRKLGNAVTTPDELTWAIESW